MTNLKKSKKVISWSDEREPSDAPPWLTHDEARCWAEGWNAAVRQCVEEQNAVLRAESPKKSSSPDKPEPILGP